MWSEKVHLIEDTAVLDGTVRERKLRKLPLGSGRCHNVGGRARKPTQRVVLRNKLHVCMYICMYVCLYVCMYYVNMMLEQMDAL